ncbi:YlxM family DNA-binding protein [Aerococcaceae bacterium DSM 111020]|nr:YlxM family DNA-binding protein [Aerococcaceae bacterium DSM 111020]
MSLEKTLLMNELFACYQDLLTTKQQEMLALYYEEDFTLAEIAEHYNISRQGVHDTVKRGEEALEHYEATIHLNENRKLKQQYINELKKTQLSAEQSKLVQKMEEL